MTSHVEFTLRPDDIEAIARRVAELLQHGSSVPAGELLDSKAAATLLGVSCEYVRAHAAELGGRKLTASPKAPWRFDASRLVAAPAPADAPVTQLPRRTAQKSRASATDLLPIRGEAA